MWRILPSRQLHCLFLRPFLANSFRCSSTKIVQDPAAVVASATSGRGQSGSSRIRELWHRLEMARKVESVLLSKSLALSDLKAVLPPTAAALKSSKKTRKVIPSIADREDVNRITLSMALSAYCEACREANELELALSKFNNYRILWQKKFKDSSKFGDLNLFRNYLSLIADLGTADDCRFIWNSMVKEGVVPDHQCYISAFRCFGRSGITSSEGSSFAQDLASQLTDADLAVFYSKGIFKRAESEELSKGLAILFPHFVPPAMKTNSSHGVYECELLRDLNGRDTSRLAPPLRSLPSNMAELLETQLEREKAGHIVLHSVLPVLSETVPSVELTASIVEEWRINLTKALADRIRGHLTPRANLVEGTMTIFPFFKILDLKEYVDIVLHEVTRMLKMSESFSPSVTLFQRNLGAAVMHQVWLKKITTGDKHYHDMFLCTYKDYLRWFSSPTGSKDWCPREAVLRLASEHKEHISLFDSHTEAEWPFPIKLAVGRELLNIVMQHMHVKVDSEGRLIIGDQLAVEADGKVVAATSSGHQRGSCPAFFKVFRTRKDQKELEELKPLPSLAKLFSLDKFSRLEFDVTELPMVVPPLPWTSNAQGGYLLRRSELIRVPSDGKTMSLEEEDASNRGLSPILDSLNQLGSTPWKMNAPVLDLVLEVFTNQTAYSKDLNALGIPRQQDQLSAPKLEPEIQTKLQNSERLSRSELKSYKGFLAQRQAFSQFKSECYSLWCDTLYRLSIANHFRDSVMYFPHNLDFRGRVYPIAPYLNHMGCDLSRSLLVFAEGKKLGPSGLDWLKLHTVNLSGLMKRHSMAERLQYAEEILPDIIDSATDPFGGRQWWVRSDEPWQTLGACMEVKAALEWYGRPEDFVSHLPIHQDGSCNGLQHYAALGRDVLGARSVNLLPDERPQDVYSEIAAIVDRKRKEDADEGQEMAQKLEGFVRRKVIKQTVMTTVYGVTKYGAKLQIARQLKDDETFPLEHVAEASKYLARKTFESLNELFRASQEIQAWFTECANVLSGSMLCNVEWRTPLGLRVVQPYIKRTKRVKSNSSDDMCSVDPFLHSSHHHDIAHAKPNVLKQRNGFPPNFVHSLDSTHMMLTSLHMWNAGCTFASVHDCYWTHAATVEVMNRVCREQFVNLHTHPILEELSESFSKKLEENVTLKASDSAKAKLLFKALPEKGDLDLNEVKKSIYFFS